jgi:hypothetical protein
MIDENFSPKAKQILALAKQESKGYINLVTGWFNA